MINKQEFYIQQGSFHKVVVSGPDANPHWIHKPIRVIDYSSYELLEKKLAKVIDQRDREIKLNDSLSNEEKLYVIAHRNEELELIK